MSISDTLNKAADLIEERGWTQGNPGMIAEADVPLCLEGALAAATGGVPVYVSTAGATNGHGVWDYSTVETCPAYLAVTRYLGPGAKRAYIWNDSPERTASDVIGVLRSAALVEAAREDAALLSEAGRV